MPGEPSPAHWSWLEQDELGQKSPTWASLRIGIVKATSSRTNLDWEKTVKKLILNNIFIDHSVRFLTDFTITKQKARSRSSLTGSMTYGEKYSGWWAEQWPGSTFRLQDSEKPEDPLSRKNGHHTMTPPGLWKNNEEKSENGHFRKSIVPFLSVGPVLSKMRPLKCGGFAKRRCFPVRLHRFTVVFPDFQRNNTQGGG